MDFFKKHEISRHTRPFNERDFNSRIPRYNDDSDYTTNAPSYYDDLARKNALLKTLSLRIWEYQEVINIQFNEWDDELRKRFLAWDKNLEEFDDEVLRLLQEWLEDGTLDHIINETIFSWKADQVDLDITNQNVSQNKSDIEALENNKADQTDLDITNQNVSQNKTDIQTLENDKADKTALSNTNDNVTVNENSIIDLQIDKVNVVDVHFNARTYGAKGQGTKDETIELQNMLDDIHSHGGGVAYIPKGEYIISDTLQVYPDTIVYGDGMNNTLIRWNDLNNDMKVIMYAVRGTDNSRNGFYGFTLDGRRSQRNLLDDQSSVGIIPIKNAVFDDVKIINTISAGISSSNGVENIRITNCHIKDTGHHCIYFSTSGSTFIKDIYIENNLLDNTAMIDGIQHGANIFKLRFEEGGHGIDNLVFRNNIMGTGNIQNAILVFVSTSDSGTSPCYLTNVDFSHNVLNYKRDLYFHIANAFYIGSNSKANNLKISDNDMFGNSTELTSQDSYGIRILISEEVENGNIDISNNRIRGFDIAIDSPRSIIRDNYLRFRKRGIFSHFNSIIDSNELISIQNGSVGIYRSIADITNNRIYVNEFSTGIELDTIYNKKITGNQIENALNGITLRSGRTMTNCILSDNIFFDCINNYSTSIAGYSDYTFEPNHIDRGSIDGVTPEGKHIGEKFYHYPNKKVYWFDGSTWRDAMGEELL